MKNLRKIIIIFCLLIIYVYFCNLYFFPDTFIIKENSKLEFNLCPFIKCESVILTNSDDDKSYKIDLTCLGIKVKSSEVKVIEDIKLVPGGNVIGIKLYSDGIMILGTSKIENEDGELVESINENEVEIGDKIIKVNGINVKNIGELKSEINKNINFIELDIEDINGNIKKVKVNAIKTSDKDYKIGLWVKDAATGVGTMTFYNKETGEFAALGHGIIEQDSERIIEIQKGEITNAKVLNINKAVSGNPGEIRGSIGEEFLGEITKNTKFGIFGVLDVNETHKNEKEYEIALREEIEIGNAKILCSIDGKSVNEYEILINEIYLNNNSSNKSFEIEIIDEELIKNTGGIIRGLSRKSYNTK